VFHATLSNTLLIAVNVTNAVLTGSSGLWSPFSMAVIKFAPPM
jgi:hypothetical protein